MRFGYARVSTQDQNLALQKDALNEAKCEQIFEEKISGKTKDRPALIELLKVLRTGDEVIVWKLDRLGRSLKDLIDLVSEIQRKGANFVSLKDSINTSTATGRFTFNIFASLAEFEREIIKERTVAGLTAARARGRKGGRPAGLTKDEMDKANSALILYNAKKKSVQEIAKQLGLSRSTCYRYINIALENESQPL